MVVGQVLARVNHSVHISLHQVSYYVYVLVPFRSGRFLHIDNADDIFVVEKLYKIIV